MCEVGTFYTKCVKWGPYTPNVWSGDLIHQVCEVGTLYTKCEKWDLIHQMCEVGTLYTKCVKWGPYTSNVWSGDFIHQMCEVGTLYTKSVKWGPYTPNVWSGDLIHQIQFRSATINVKITNRNSFIPLRLYTIPFIPLLWLSVGRFARN